MNWGWKMLGKRRAVSGKVRVTQFQKNFDKMWKIGEKFLKNLNTFKEN